MNTGRYWLQAGSLKRFRSRQTETRGSRLSRRLHSITQVELERRARAWREERTELLKRRVWPAVLPIVGENEQNRPEAVGSGVLLSIDEELFLLTTAHVLDLKKTFPLHVGVGSRSTAAWHERWGAVRLRFPLRPATRGS